MYTECARVCLCRRTLLQTYPNGLLINSFVQTTNPGDVTNRFNQAISDGELRRDLQGINLDLSSQDSFARVSEHLKPCSAVHMSLQTLYGALPRDRLQ